MDNGKYVFKISDDDKKVCELLELNYDDVCKSNYDEFFNLVLNSKYFFRSKFIEDSSNGRCNLLIKISEYLKNNETTSKPRIRLSTENLIKFFKSDFTINYNKVCFILSSEIAINQKFNGNIILEKVPNYDKTKLNITIPYFTKSMSNIELQYFILSSTTDEIVERFLSDTNHLLA
jgi:hypothetical protein